VTDRKKKILVVEDDSTIRELFCSLLTAAGFEAEGAEHALAAVCAIVREKPDLILADIRMPIVDGLSLVRELKAHGDSGHIPIIAVTGLDTKESREAATEAGCDGYITKPIEAGAFAGQIREFLRLRESRPT